MQETVLFWRSNQVIPQPWDAPFQFSSPPSDVLQSSEFPAVASLSLALSVGRDHGKKEASRESSQPKLTVESGHMVTTVSHSGWGTAHTSPPLRSGPLGISSGKSLFPTQERRDGLSQWEHLQIHCNTIPLGFCGSMFAASCASSQSGEARNLRGQQEELSYRNRCWVSDGG